MKKNVQKSKYIKLNKLNIEKLASLILSMKESYKNSRHYKNAVKELFARKLTFNKFPESSNSYKKIFSVLD